ncbi:CRISPR-associated protein Cas5 [Thermococcus sp.]|uniref:CRISPR-associated protein Cas5 n=1 Tax=Thermococcus sp. TaxID=35749 RepID=UPI0026258A93|nr:CRISPR-associated protein Cas5 [Thermococcus sp.]
MTKWLKLVIHFPSFYSYRIPEYSSQYALALPIIAPSTIKLAIISTAIRISGKVEEGKRIFNYIKDAKVGVKPPEKIVINSVFIKRLKKKDGISISAEGIGKIIKTNKDLIIKADSDVPVFKIGGKSPMGYYIPGKLEVNIKSQNIIVSNLIIWNKDVKIIKDGSEGFMSLKLTKNETEMLSKEEKERKKRELNELKKKLEDMHKEKLEAFLFLNKEKFKEQVLHSSEEFTIYILSRNSEKFTIIEPRGKREFIFQSASTLASGFQESFGVREYVHFSGDVEVYLGLPDDVPGEIKHYARHIRYFGTSDSLAYVKSAECVNEPPQGIVFPVVISEVPPDSYIYPVKDFSSKATFEQINPYSSKNLGRPYKTKYYALRLSKRPIDGSNWKVLFIS